MWLRNSKFIYFYKHQEASSFALFRYDLIEKLEAEVEGFSIPFDKKLGLPIGTVFAHLGIEEMKTKPKPQNEEDFLRQQMVIILYSKDSVE